MVALNEEAISSVQPFDKSEPRHLIELPAWSAIALLATQNEVPNPVDGSAQAMRL
jgi:hypothetical protein